MKKSKRLPQNVTGFYGDWVGAYPCAELHVRIVQSGPILRCIQMTDCECMPMGTVQWQYDLHSMCGIALIMESLDTIDLSCPCKSALKTMSMRLGAVSYTHLRAHETPEH